MRQRDSRGHRRGQGAVVFGSVSDEHEGRTPRQSAEETGEHGLARLVDPVRVFDNVDSGCATRQQRHVEERRQPPLPGVRRDVVLPQRRLGDAEHVVE